MKRMWWSGNEEREEDVGNEKSKSRSGATREKKGQEKGSQDSV